jgi:hypothetical protein
MLRVDDRDEMPSRARRCRCRRLTAFLNSMLYLQIKKPLGAGNRLGANRVKTGLEVSQSFQAVLFYSFYIITYRL